MARNEPRGKSPGTHNPAPKPQPSNLPLCPTDEQEHDKTNPQRFPRSDQAALFHRTAYSSVIARSVSSLTHTQATSTPDFSTDTNDHLYHVSPAGVAYASITIPHQPTPTSEHPAIKYPTSHPHTPRQLVTQVSSGSFGVRCIDSQSDARSPTSSMMLPSFRDFIQDIGPSAQSAHRSETNYRPSSRNTGPQLWPGPQSLDSPIRGLVPVQNVPTIAPSFSTPTPIAAEGDMRAQTPFSRLSPSKMPHILNSRSTHEGEISAQNQPLDQHLNPTITLGAERKRKQAPDLPGDTSRPSKRRSTGDRGPADAQEEAPLGSSLGLDRLLSDQSGSSTARRLPTITGFHVLEPIQGCSNATPTSGGDFFTNATNTVINDSNMTAIGNIQHVSVQNYHSDEATLRWLKESTMRSAEYDSADRDPPPRCHPGTRTTIIQKVQDWLESSRREKNLLWLRGTAGAGKSAIAQTLAESLSQGGRLGASLFFSRPNGRSNPRQILPTLAYQFAVQDPSYKQYITQLMTTNPESLNKAMSEQFRLLIVEPFARKGIRRETEAWVVALDGLDECGGDPNGKRHSNDVQCDVVRLISDFVRQYPTVPLIWIISSRPETHLKAVFSEQGVVPSFWEEDVPVDSDEACEDVEKFLHNEFMKISEKYPDLIRESPWPTNKQFLKIAHAALGLFIFAEVVIHFIDDPEIGNPVAQLEDVQLAISNMPQTMDRDNPLATLDAIYTAILSKIPLRTLPITKRLLAFLMFLNTKGIGATRCTFRLIWKFLDVSEDAAVTALRHLHSVLHFPRPKEIGEVRPRFYHASFRDFLQDESRSHEYFVDKQAIVAESFEGIARVAQAQLSEPVTRILPVADERNEDGPEYLVSKFVKCVFRGNFSSDGVCLSFYGINGSLSDVQLQSFLESLNAFNVLKYVPEVFGPLWRDDGEHEHELSRRGFFSQITIGSLNVNWDTVSITTSRLNSQYLHIHLEESTGTNTEPRADNRTLRHVRHFFTTKTTGRYTNAFILGHRRSNCRVVVVKSDGQEKYVITGEVSCLVT